MASGLTVFPIPSLADNYIWCIHDGCNAVIVDPGDAQPVVSAFRQHNLRLDAILITHHHWDHTAGIRDVLDTLGDVPVIGPQNEAIQELTKHVKEGDTVCVGTFELQLEVVEVPGHTMDHIAFYSDDWLFSGDSLFCAGCGRLFEGTPTHMHTSLQKLNKLAGHVKVYCAHEYTLSNLRFAQAVEPKNKDIARALDDVQSMLTAKLPSLPSTIALERKINPFLRAHLRENWEHIQQKSGLSVTDEQSAFAAIRSWKDSF